MSIQISGTDGFIFSDSTTQATAGFTHFRNRILNGDMRIDQRNNGLLITAAPGEFPVDRFIFGYVSTSGTTGMQMQRSADAPPGFTNSVMLKTITAVNDVTDCYLSQTLEYSNYSDFQYGTAGAKPTVLSFWVKSSVVGTYSACILNKWTVAPRMSIVLTYTINQANTWEYKSLVIPGCSIGTWPNAGIDEGLMVFFELGSDAAKYVTANTGVWQTQAYMNTSGQVKLPKLTNAQFNITGVQLEKGSVATPFEFRSYGSELISCQRYFENGLFHNEYTDGGAANAAYIYPVRFNVVKRATPTITVKGATYYQGGNGGVPIPTYSTIGGGANGFSLYAQGMTNCHGISGGNWAAQSEV